MKNENAMRNLRAALHAYPNPLDMPPGDAILEAAQPRLLERAKIALKAGHVDLGKDLGLAATAVILLNQLVIVQRMIDDELKAPTRNYKSRRQCLEASVKAMRDMLTNVDVFAHLKS